MITQGDAAHPVKLNDHFFGPKIKEVHWASGGIGILQIDCPQGLVYNLQVDPLNQLTTKLYFSGDEILSADVWPSPPGSANISREVYFASGAPVGTIYDHSSTGKSSWHTDGPCWTIAPPNGWTIPDRFPQCFNSPDKPPIVPPGFVPFWDDEEGPFFRADKARHEGVPGKRWFVTADLRANDSDLKPASWSGDNNFSYRTPTLNRVVGPDQNGNVICAFDYSDPISVSYPGWQAVNAGLTPYVPPTLSSWALGQTSIPTSGDKCVLNRFVYLINFGEPGGSANIDIVSPGASNPNIIGYQSLFKLTIASGAKLFAGPNRTVTFSGAGPFVTGSKSVPFDQPSEPPGGVVATFNSKGFV